MLKKIKESSLAILLILGLSAPSGLFALANPQSCSYYLDFLDYKLDNASSKYSKKDIEFVKKGFNNYNNYIKAGIEKNINAYYKDSVKRAEFKKEISKSGEFVMNRYKKQYKDNILYADFAMVINDCSKVAPVQGARLEELKKAYETFLKLIYEK